jgi:ABC-type phosphate transport system auxiliary subunit
MDRSDLTVVVAKLRAELAEIRSQIVEYRLRKRHSQLDAKVHSERNGRIREIRAELEKMMDPKRRERLRRILRDDHMR